MAPGFLLEKKQSRHKNGSGNNHFLISYVPTHPLKQVKCITPNRSTMRNVIKVVREALLNNFKELDQWFEKDAALLHFKPERDQWSVREVLEHITLTNYFLLLIINKSTRRALDRKSAGHNVIVPGDYEDKFRQIDVIGSKSFGWSRAEHMEPTGFKEMAEIKALLKQQYAQCMYNLSLLKNGEGRLVFTNMSVNHLGKLDIYQYIYFLTKHIERHIHQMERLEKQFEESMILI